MKEKSKENIVEFMGNLGLNEKEVKVYMLGLTQGPQYVASLAKALSWSRPNTYNIVHKLSEKGLCASVTTSSGKKVRMIDVESIEKLLNTEIGKSEKLKEKLKSISKDFEKIKSVKPISQPRVTYYEGIKGLQNLFQDQLYVKDKIIRIALSETNLIKSIGMEFARYFVEERAKRGIVSRALRKELVYTDDPIFADPKKYLREVKDAPKDISFKTTIIIYDQKVAFLTSDQENFGTLIESEDYASTLRDWFDHIWKRS